MKLSSSFRVVSFFGQLVGCVFASVSASSSSQAVSIEPDKSIEPAKKAPDTSIEKPDIFASTQSVGCESNSVVAAWCVDDDAVSAGAALVDENDVPNKKQKRCGLLPSFDEYGCTCYGDPSKCPTDCIGGDVPIEKTHYSIRCNGIPDPATAPNYILKEWHAIDRCEENSIVSAWCNDYINRHLECKINTVDNQYLCKCTGKQTNCPDECIDGTNPILRGHNSVICSGIPNDNPNYVLTSTIAM
jgi:hypothetical protein